jgi:predicted nucleic acid-binding protein
VSEFLYDDIGLVDTSAVLELHREGAPFHAEAKRFFGERTGVTWCVLNATSHEAFTRQRYDVRLESALDTYGFMRGVQFRQLDFNQADEDRAIELLRKYRDQTLSFHDALCAAVMLRNGIYKVFTFDSDFWCFGFAVLPGVTK